MELLEAIEKRHSVRSYLDKKIEGETEKELISIIQECNKESGLNIQLCLNKPEAFDSMMAHYGKFKNVKNYIALIGKKDKNLQELCGYYGEKIVLKAMQLGLNTCWAALSYNKRKIACKIEQGEKLCCIIAVGYGETQGSPHSVKKIQELCHVEGEMPNWFRDGMKAVQLAPTAINQQRFLFTLNENIVNVKALQGFYTKIDLGIVKYHFEIGANRKI